jgi:integrase
MAIINLTQSIIPTLQCPEGKRRIEYCDKEMAGLFLEVRPSGASTYYLRYKAENQTKYIKLGTSDITSLADVRKKAKTLKAEIELGADPRGEANAKKAMLTFAEFVEIHYLPFVKPRKRSWKRDDELYRLRIKDAFGNKRLNQITRQQIQTFHAAVLAEGLAPATADHHLKLIRQSLNLAIDWGFLMDKNPAARVHLFNVDNKVEHYLNDDELERLLEVLRTDDNRTVCNIAMFLLSTGSRLNEALSATWSMVDRANRVWRIAASNSKSKRIRTVPLNDSALDVLNKLNTKEFFDHLFINKQTGLPYTTIMKVWTRLRNKAGLPHLRIHDLRHQYASFLANSGRTLYEIQSILGHSDAKVTERYAHLSTKTLQNAANSASVIIKGAMKEAA